MTPQEKARLLRPMIEKAAVSLPDEDAVSVVDLFPAWKEGVHYSAGARVRHNGTLYRCLQPHDAQVNWTPTTVPSLWVKVLIPDPEVIPSWEQPNSTNPYHKGDRVRYRGRIYESMIDGNIWPPDADDLLWREISI